MAQSFKVGDTVAANVEGVFYDKNAVGSVTGANQHGRFMVVTFTNGAKRADFLRQLVNPENFRLIPKA